jgi:hypothetical protein
MRSPGHIPLAALAAALWLVGCSSGSGLRPGDEGYLPVPLGRLQSQQQNGVTVQMEVPTAEEAEGLLGVDFTRHGIQPIWIRIQNDSDTDYWLLPVAIDPDYFSPDEAAFSAGTRLDEQGLENLRGLLRANALPLFHRAGSATEGYIFASEATGGRFVDVRLAGHRRSVRMRFAVLLPTQGFDYEQSELRQRYAVVDTLPDLTLDEFRERLRDLPCCTHNAEGSGEGDPLNVVFVGTGQDTIAALVASGWQFTEAITADSVRRMIGAAIAEKSFMSAPVSALYAFGRKQDIAMQRGRSTISQRNHMRLWLAPFRCEGKPVWIGQVSRDIGVKMTTKSPTLTTHVIDPVVDEAREYVLASLLHKDAVSRFTFAQGVGEAPTFRPRFNLADDPYVTDGMRLVVWVSSEPVPPHEADHLKWNPIADPVRLGSGQYQRVPLRPDDAAPPPEE